MFAIKYREENMIDRNKAKTWSRDRIREELTELRRLVSGLEEDIREREDTSRAFLERAERYKEAGDYWAADSWEDKAGEPYDSVNQLNEGIAEIEKDIAFLVSLFDGEDVEESEKDNQTNTTSYTISPSYRPIDRPVSYVDNREKRNEKSRGFFKGLAKLVVGIAALGGAAYLVHSCYNSSSKITSASSQKFYERRMIPESLHDIATRDLRQRYLNGKLEEKVESAKTEPYQEKPRQKATGIVDKFRVNLDNDLSYFSPLEQSLEKWRKDNLPNLRTFTFNSFSEIGENVWATGYRQGYGGNGHLLYSPDYGKSWRILSKNERANYLRVFFFNKLEGVIATDGGIAKTNNGGINWETLLYIGRIPTLSIHILEDAEIWNRKVMRARLRGHFSERIETIDGGQRWDYVVYHGQRYGSRSIRFSTYDGGRSWVKNQ